MQVKEISWFDCGACPERKITVTASNSKPSSLRRVIHQGLVMASLLFNICVYDQPLITSIKFAYADNQAIPSSVWRIEEVGKDSHPGHDYSSCLSPDLETEAQSSKNNDGSLSPLLPRGQA